MANARVLIVLLTYKSRLDWLREAIHSVRAQSYQDLRCIVADSTPDDKQAIGVGMALGPGTEGVDTINFGCDAKVRYVRYPHQPTADVAFKVNESVKLYGKDCDYICVMSDDDYLSPFFLEKQVGRLEAHPSYGFAQGYTCLFGDVNHLWMHEEGLGVREQISGNRFAGTCVMRMKPFLEFGGYETAVVPEGFPCGLEDFNLFVHFLRAGWGYGVVKEPLLFARQRPDQNNRKLYGTPLYLKMIQAICDKQGIQFRLVPGQPEDPRFPEASKVAQAAYEAAQQAAKTANALKAKPDCFEIKWEQLELVPANNSAKTAN